MARSGEANSTWYAMVMVLCNPDARPGPLLEDAAREKEEEQEEEGEGEPEKKKERKGLVEQVR